MAAKIEDSFTPYPGYNGVIEEQRFCNKSINRAIFGNIADHLSLKELHFTTARLNRQFRSMTFVYIKSQLPLLKRVYDFCYLCFITLKQVQGKELFPKSLATVENYRLIVEAKNTYLDVSFTTNQAMRKTFAHFPLFFSNLNVKIFDQLIKNIKRNFQKLPNSFNLFFETLQVQISCNNHIPLSVEMIENMMNKRVVNPNLPTIEKRMKESKDKEYYFKHFYLYMNYFYARQGKNYLELLPPLDDSIHTGFKQFCPGIHDRALAIHAIALGTAERGQVDLACKLLKSQQVVTFANQFETSTVLATIVEISLVANNPDKALALVRYFCCVRKNGDFADALERMGAYYLERDQIDKAIELFFECGCFEQKSTNMFPNGSKLGTRIINYLLSKNKLTEALNFVSDDRITRMVKAHLDVPFVNYYLSIGNCEEALKFVSEELESCFKPYEGLCTLSLMTIYYGERGDLDSLIELVNQNISFYRRKFVFILNSLLNYGHGEKAFQLVTSFDPDYASRHNGFLDTYDEGYLVIVRHFLQKNDLQRALLVIERTSNRKTASQFGCQFGCLLELLKYHYKNENYEEALTLAKRMQQGIDRKRAVLQDFEYEIYIMFINLHLKRGEKEEAKALLSLFYDKDSYLEKIEAGHLLEIPPTRQEKSKISIPRGITVYGEGQTLLIQF